MQNNVIASCGIGVKVEFEGLDAEKVWAEILSNKLLNRFIPNFGMEGEVVATLRVINSSTAKELKFDSTISSLRGNFGEDFSTTDIIVLSEYLLERHRQSKGIYIVHSSSVFKDNKGVLLMANLTGAGKTSTSLYMQNKLGYSIYSDEKTLVSPSQKLLVGQVAKIYLEDKTKKALELENIIFEEEISIIQAGDKKLSLIIVPMVTDHLETAVVRKYSEAQLKWILYEEFSKDIRLVNGMIFNMSMPLMSLDTKDLAQERLNRASELSETTPCYFIQGSLSQIGEVIEDLISKPR